MRCDACNVPLSPKEDSRKSVATGERIGLCDPCFAPIQDEVETVVNESASNVTPNLKG